MPPNLQALREGRQADLWSAEFAIGCKRNIGTDLAAVALNWRSVCRTTNREDDTEEGLFVDELLALVGG